MWFELILHTSTISHVKIIFTNIKIYINVKKRIKAKCKISDYQSNFYFGDYIVCVKYFLNLKKIESSSKRDSQNCIKSRSTSEAVFRCCRS